MIELLGRGAGGGRGSWNIGVISCSRHICKHQIACWAAIVAIATTYGLFLRNYQLYGMVGTLHFEDLPDGAMWYADVLKQGATSSIPDFRIDP